MDGRRERADEEKREGERRCEEKAGAIWSARTGRRDAELS